MNILCNPTGQPGKFCAIDWWIEYNNLFLKVSQVISIEIIMTLTSQKRIYGGKFSNHTKACIIKESPLIEVFKNTQIQVGKLFQLDRHTMWHSPAKLQKTFNALGVYERQEQANEFVGG
jgi:uncharacterized protein (UPF0179 family)